jgi:head-tail adaptor
MSLSTSLDGVQATALRGLTMLSLSDSGHTITLTSTSDSGGGATSTSASGSTIPCRVDPIGGGEASIAERIDDRSTHRIMIPASTTINTAERFVVTGWGTFEITAVRERTRTQVRILEAVIRD